MFVAGNRVVVRWERLRRQNHWLDALYNACAAGHLASVRLVDEQAKPAPPNPEPRPPQDSPYDTSPWIWMQRLGLEARRW